MQKMIFNIKNNTDFERVSLQIFNFQANNNLVYKKYLSGININPKKISSIKKIPFLPIEFFKTKKVISFEYVPKKKYLNFESSGTTSNFKSKHYINKVSVYEKSFILNFNNFYGDIQDYTILAILPSYIENENSSLIYMVNKLIQLTKNADSGFYLYNTQELTDKLYKLKQAKQKTILFGVSFALLELAEKYNFNLPELIIMETGGMKGMREEITREELHTKLRKSFNTNHIHSEYGMTELLSQAYSQNNEKFKTPNWMKIFIRDINDPFCILGHNKTGGINIIDLANIYSCSFIETKDLGKLFPDNSFEVLGRFDNSDIRGCNLLSL